MFAVIKTGGKQYTVKEGDTFNVEKIEAEKDATYKIEEVLFISGDNKQTAGSPFIKGASVEVKVLEELVVCFSLGLYEIIKLCRRHRV